jgi:hypothetical protein
MKTSDELEQLKSEFTTHTARVQRAVRDLNISLMAWHDLLMQHQDKLPIEFNEFGSHIHVKQIEALSDLKAAMQDTAWDITEIVSVFIETKRDDENK